MQIQSELNGPGNFIECTNSASNIAGDSRSDNDASPHHSRIFTDVKQLNQQQDDSDSKIILTKLSFSAHKASFISASNSAIEGGQLNLPSRIHKSSSAHSLHIQQTIE